MTLACAAVCDHDAVTNAALRAAMAPTSQLDLCAVASKVAIGRYNLGLITSKPPTYLRTS